MTFRTSFRVLTFATSLWAFLMLAAFSELHAPAIAIYAAAFLLAIFRERIGFRLPGMLWLAISLGALGLALAGWFSFSARMYSVVYLFMYLHANKLLTAEHNRDYLQIYCLTFFMVLAASVSTSTIFFAPMLLVYLFLILAALITVTTKRDAEQAFPARPEGAATGLKPVRVRAHERLRLERLFAKDYFTRPFVGWLSGALVAILAVGIGLFFIIPRLQARQFLSSIAAKSEIAKSGFSDTVEFGNAGEIQTDATVVGRAFPLRGYDMEGDRPAIPVLRLRGTSLDSYDGRRWTKSAQARAGVIPMRQRTFSFILPESFDSGKRAVTRLMLEPSRRTYLFGPDRTQSFEFASERDLMFDRLGVSLQTNLSTWSGQLEYATTSYQPAENWYEQLRRTAAPAPEDMKTGIADTARNLGESIANILASPPAPGRRGLDLGERKLNTDLPAHPDMETVRRLAAEWTAGMDDTLDIVRAIELRLKRDYNYSLDVDFSKDDRHLSRFLEAEKAGHCEYFATAMVLMLRSLGIPARIVNGFATDEWNASGSYYLIRQEHAHSWVEAYFGSAGWMTFDPTPISGIGGRSEMGWLMRRLSQIYDRIKLAWYETVIDYDMSRQAFMYRYIFRAMSMIPDFGKIFDREFLQRPAVSRALRPKSLLMAAGALGAALSLVLLLREAAAYRRLRLRVAELAGRAEHEPDRKLYLELLVAMEEVLPRNGAQTPLEYALAVRGKASHLAEFVPLTRSYYGVRYRGAGWTDEDRARANGLLRLIEDGPGNGGKT